MKTLLLKSIGIIYMYPINQQHRNIFISKAMGITIHLNYKDEKILNILPIVLLIHFFYTKIFIENPMVAVKCYYPTFVMFIFIVKYEKNKLPLLRSTYFYPF